MQTGSNWLYNKLNFQTLPFSPRFSRPLHHAFCFFILQLFTQREDFPTSIWSCLCKPTLHMVYAIVLWCASVNSRPISAEQFSHVINPLVLYSLASDSNGIATPVRYLTQSLSTIEFRSNFVLSLSRKLLRDLIK